MTATAAPKFEPHGAKPLAVRSVGIVGAGLMGTAIAAAAVKSRLSVVLCDSNPRALDTVAARLAAEFDDGDRRVAFRCRIAARLANPHRRPVANGRLPTHHRIDRRECGGQAATLR